ncbi:MAG TPA: DUF4105 domain-containing protein [Candidatus Paceibacterota bacterium]|nr:DUF4105 domain-containing protein [Candidatus Paceibacterota bacterium]
MTPPEESWRVTHRTLASIAFEGDVAHIRDIRDFRYPSGIEDKPEERYLNRDIPLAEIESAWLSVIPFRPHFAHLVTSFGMRDGAHLAISVEIRYRDGEPYALWKTLYPHYWLSYVIATEDDVFRLRTDVRAGESIYLYRLAFSPAQAQHLFADMLLRADHVNQHSFERFNSAMNSCSSNVLRHLARAAGRPLPVHQSHFFTEHLDHHLAREGFLAAPALLTEKARARRLINPLARMIPPDAADFSARIRAHIA